MTVYTYLTRKQVIVVWQDADGEHSANYPRNEAGHRRANAKVARLLADGYERTDAPKDWYTALIDAAIAARATPQPEGES